MTGVVSVEVNYITNKVEVVYDPELVSLDKLRMAIEEEERDGNSAAYPNPIAAKASRSEREHLSVRTHRSNRAFDALLAYHSLFVNNSSRFGLRNLSHVLTSALQSAIVGVPPI